jgi:hypothetical protein
MSLAETVRALKIHLERSIEVANIILELISLDTDSESEVSSESNYASTDENECYIPAAPLLVRSETYLDVPVDRPGTPSMLGPPLPQKVYKKIDIERFDE